MSDQTDWDEIRRFAFADDRPPEWPGDVGRITMEGLTLFGLDSRHRLYWDGNPVEVRKSFDLTGLQKLGAVAVTLSAIVGALSAAASAAVDLNLL